MISSYAGNIVIGGGTLLGDLLLLWIPRQKAREKAQGFVCKKLSLLNTHFISVNNNNK
jgi:hypothetical protein